MRKPNYGEAVDQYTQIMNSFKREGNNMYAAFCCLSIGRCEQAIKANSSAEASCYIDSGYLLWETEVLAAETDEISFEENITEAINCYLLAIKKLRKYEESSDYYHKAAEIMRTESPISAINSLKEATTCKILESDYKGACDYLDLIVTIASESIPQDAFLKSQAHLGKLVNDINDQEGQSSDLTDETIDLLNNLLVCAKDIIPLN
eukprot:gene6615-7688_t